MGGRATGPRTATAERRITLMTAQGPRTITSTLARPDLPMPVCGRPERIRPLIEAAADLLVAIPAASSTKVEGGLRRFREALEFWGVDDKDVTPSVVLAFITLRCARPPDAEVPSSMKRRVVPATAAGDIDAINRAIRLGVPGTAPYAEAFGAPQVNQILRSINARQRRLKTTKLPLLFHTVANMVKTALASRRSTRKFELRDAYAVAVAFVFGLRLSELLALNVKDFELDRDILTVILRSTKTHQSLLKLHDPIRVASSHPLLLAIHRTFHAEVTLPGPEAPMFFRMVGRTADRLGRSWFETAIRKIAPGATPHSTRVGMATEMYAAGIPLTHIMAAGRWRSLTAVLYIIGTLDQSIDATAKLGSAGVIRVGRDLRQNLQSEFIAWRPDPEADGDSDDDE